MTLPGAFSGNGANGARAAHKAADLLREFAIDSVEGLELETLAMARGVLVVNGGLRGAAARLVRVNQQGVIRVNASGHSAARLRFSIAHELGHWELHDGQSQAGLCQDADLNDYSRSPEEIEANLFAAELLMPARLFRARVAEQAPDMENIMAAARAFTVSFTAAALRFVQYCKEDCFIVASSGNKVDWHKKADRHGLKLFLQTGQGISRGSDAFDCAATPAALGRMRRVEPALWFPDSARLSQFRLSEQSVRLVRYEQTLTLLWVQPREDYEE